MLTNQSPPLPQAISWTWTSPVQWPMRGRKQASCRALGLKPAGDGGGVVVFPDLQRRADGQPVAVAGQAHRLAEAAEVGVQRTVVGPEHHQLAGLIRGDENRQAQLLEEPWEAGGMHAAQRRRCLLVAGLGRVSHIRASSGLTGNQNVTEQALAQPDRRHDGANDRIRRAWPGRRDAPDCRFPLAGRNGLQLRWVVAGRGRTVSPRRTNVAAPSIQASFPAGRAVDALRGLRER